MSFYSRHTRWREYESVLKSGVSGAMFVWEFTGYTEEIQVNLPPDVVAPCLPSGELLKRIAAREFGKGNVAIMMMHGVVLIVLWIISRFQGT